jgi:hypothetical protein
MLPTWQQIEKAAYDRWERRGWTHGHDRDDWVAAEQDLTFDMNYRTICQLPLAAGDVPAVRRVCSAVDSASNRRPGSRSGPAGRSFHLACMLCYRLARSVVSVTGNSRRPSIKTSPGSGVRWPA